MIRVLSLCLIVLFLAAPVQADPLTGKYVEARTCDVWTGPCFANADFNITGKHAVLAWQVDNGKFNGVNLDGLGIVAVVASSDTLGLKQTGPAKVVMIVDKQANRSQREALISMAKKQAGTLLNNVVAIQEAKVELKLCLDCKEKNCADLIAGKAKIKTRCLHSDHDKVCGNESAYYPPLSGNVDATPAAVVEHAYTGAGLGGTWRDFERRGAYVGAFRIR